MRGSIVQKGKYFYVVVYLGRNDFGKKEQRWFSGFKTRKQAEKALPRILVKVEDGELHRSNNKDLGSFLKEWLFSKTKKDALSPTTVDGYENIINNHLIPSLGQLKLQDIKAYNLQKYFDSKFGELSARTLANHKRVLSSALSYAEDMELIENNPIRKVRMPRERKEEIIPYSLEEAKMLLEKISDNRLLCIPVSLALLLGLRRGECLALRWSDIDFENNIIHIRQNLECVRGICYLKEPKTINSIRDISAPETLIQILKEHQKWQREMKLRSGGSWINENDLICVKPSDGGIIKPTRISDSFRKFLLENNLPLIRFHDLRHTNATIMLAAEISSKVAQKRLGHSNVSITLDLYSHVLQSVDYSASEKIEKLFNPN